MLLDEVMTILSPKEGEVYLDCTAGLGGHAAEVAQRVGRSGCVVLNDVDPGNLKEAEARIRAACQGGNVPRIAIMQGNFADAPRRLAELGLKADLVLADLGFSSNQVQDPARGFSFMREGPLDMRMDPTLAMSAADLVASLSQPELTAILREFGEERDASRIARRIVEARAAGPIQTTGQLAEIVRGPRVSRPGMIDPATRTFQALRIAVNDELGSLNSLLAAVEKGAREASSPDPAWLIPGARVAVITFHSLEDRAVKHAFRGLAERGLAVDLARRPIQAGEPEQAANPRARSAKLRAIRVLGPARNQADDETSEDDGRR